MKDIYKNLLEKTSLEFYVANVNGYFLHANNAACKTLGYSLEELQKLHLCDVDPNFDEKALDEFIKFIRVEENRLIETKHKLKDGTIYDAEVSVTYVKDGDDEYIIGFARDISDRKKLQESLAESSRRYESILRSSKDGFLLVDTKGDILDVNESFCELTEYSKDELLSMNVNDIDVIESVEETKQHIENIIKTGSEIFETYQKKKSGEVFPVEVSTTFYPHEGGRFCSLIRDISARKLEDEIKSFKNQLTDLIRITKQDELMQTALDKAEELSKSKIGFFHFVDEDEENISLQVWSTNTLQKMCFAEGNGLHYPVSSAGVWVDCIHQRKTIIHNDYASLPHKKGMPEGHAKLVRELTVPIFRNGKIVAVIGVGNKESEYTQSDAKIVEEIADITFDFIERQQAEEKIQFMAYYDTLTNIPNRSLLSDRLNQALAFAKRSKEMVAICYMDLDGFKPINDSLGHHVGDLLLIDFAKRLQEEVREVDTVARLGGDEFVILLTEIKTVYEVEEIVQRLLKKLKEPFNIKENRIHISCSIGVTVYPVDNSDADVLLRHADQAMYKAKEDGRADYKIYEKVENKTYLETKKLLSEIDNAITEKQLELYYQPKVDLKNGDVIGVEALIRWNHPTKGLLMPADFLPILEYKPQEIALGEYVVKSAMEQLIKWQKQGIDLGLSINISPRQIQLDDFPLFLEKTLKNYGEELAEKIELEILEIAAIYDTKKVSKIMERCKKLGLSFSLDDFGTGYSSLTHFYQLPIDILKIDQNFVKQMLEKTSDLDIIEGVLKLAESLKRPVIAEGVESEEIGLMLLQMGCSFAQGYAIAKPMPAKDFPSWLESWNDNSIWHSFGKNISNKEIHSDLNVAIYSHHLWLERVLNFLNSGELFDFEILDSDNCQMSRWYRGIGKTRYGHREFYAFIQKEHNIVHQLAEMLVTKKENREEISEQEIEELKIASDVLLNTLKKLGE